MTSTPQVSVVMSVYNGERFLPAALESVLSQEGVDLEVVAVDDGSTDASAEVLTAYEARDARVRIVLQANTGLTRALARGCSEAKGTFIARQDADDLSMPGRLRELASILQARPDVAVASSWVEGIGPGDEFLTRTTYPEGTDAGTKAVVERKLNPVHGATMFRKADLEAVGGYRPQFFVAQDADLWLRLSERGDVFFIPEVLYRFRIAEGSISAQHRGAQVQLHELALRCYKARAEGESESRWLEEAACIRPGRSGPFLTAKGAGLYFIGRTLIKNRDPRASTYLEAFVRQRPLDPKGWLSLLQARMLSGSRGTRG